MQPTKLVRAHTKNGVKISVFPYFLECLCTNSAQISETCASQLHALETIQSYGRN